MKYKTTIILVLILLLSACARVSSPTGGPEDENPPQLLRSVPEDEQLNYKGTSILLVFDEIVQTNQIESGLIITPKPPGSFRTRGNRNTVELIFSEPFSDSTTYSFSFANTIQDVTARNPAQNLNLSFSTGDYLDSLSISGKILNLYDQLPIEGLQVSLFSANDSLTVLNGNAQYYAKTDSAGGYRFKNLPNGQYRIYAFADKNNNNKADSDGELYGFFTDTLNLNNNIADIDFTVQKLSTKELRLVSGRQFGPYFELTFNKAITAFDILEGEDYVYTKRDNDQIRFFRTNELFNDTTDLIFQAQDSIGNVLIDTASYYFGESDLASEEFKITLTPSKSLLRPEEDITLKLNKPFTHIQFDSLSFSLDSLNVFPFPKGTVDTLPLNMGIRFPFKIKQYAPRPDQRLTLTVKAGAFISVEGDSTKTFKTVFDAAIEQETALISGRVNTNGLPIIVQLLNARSLEIVAQTTAPNFSFSYLNAGAYMIRVIHDKNGNGIWDIGNILENEAPEPATFYVDETYNSQLIEVRKNWAREGLTINLR